MPDASSSEPVTERNQPLFALLAIGLLTAGAALVAAIISGVLASKGDLGGAATAGSWANGFFIIAVVTLVGRIVAAAVLFRPKVIWADAAQAARYQAWLREHRTVDTPSLRETFRQVDAVAESTADR